ncbi:MAG: 1-deoxy-D-xylulose-5-phosphate synthase [Phycisphaerales bacterium]|nr:1-deoxy-D-xylulose-5-phosphate synthase [Phycisphaerales bacterium]
MSLLSNIHSPHDLRALPLEALPQLCEEIRKTIYLQCSESGGHLAPNLGVVELTVAMHRVFDFGHDRLLFDVGHQCYTHKLLTGRQHLLSRLRQRDGMSGFPEPRESNYDLFSVGHAGTAISTAVGMARGDQLSGEHWTSSNESGRRVVSLIGDASIVNGVAMEGLNNAGTLGRQFLVVLNDNGMSIAKPQGAVASYFERVRLSQSYANFKRTAKEVAKKLPGGGVMSEIYHRMGEMSKAAISEDAWFEHFGIVAVGPIDGHDLPTLIDFLNEAKHFDRPMVLHVNTQKGRGFASTESDPTGTHSPGPFVMPNVEQEGCRIEVRKSGRSFTAAFGEAMCKLMDRDPKVVACTAAMPDGTGINKVLAKFPDRSWDTGICESHALDMMAGLAKTGWKPFMAVYSTFFQRAFDQAFQEAALQGLPVRLCFDRAGLVGGDGAVHHGFCDISLLATLPKSCILAPMDEASLIESLVFMAAYEDGISAMRYPRETVDTRLAKEPCPAFELGKARALVRHARPDCAILAYGVMAIEALDAIRVLDADHRVEVYDARFAKPVDGELLSRLLTAGVPVVTVEDHSLRGGFGSCVLEAGNELGLDTRLVTRLGLPDSWIYQGERRDQLAEAGIDAASIARHVRNRLDDKSSGCDVLNHDCGIVTA